MRALSKDEQEEGGFFTQKKMRWGERRGEGGTESQDKDQIEDARQDELIRIFSDLP